MSDTVTTLLTTWDHKAATESLISASTLIDFLLDLHLELSDHPVDALLQQWITAASQRSLFSAEDVGGLLTQIKAQLKSPAAFQINEYLNLR